MVLSAAVLYTCHLPLSNAVQSVVGGLGLLLVNSNATLAEDSGAANSAA